MTIWHHRGSPGCYHDWVLAGATTGSDGWRCRRCPARVETGIDEGHPWMVGDHPCRWPGTCQVEDPESYRDPSGCLRCMTRLADGRAGVAMLTMVATRLVGLVGRVARRLRRG